jgi:hypothetical protein
MWKYGTILYWSEDDQAYIKGAIMADRIDIHPDICNGRPIIAGTRIPVQTIMEFLGAGDSIEEVLTHRWAHNSAGGRRESYEPTVERA